MEYFLKNNLINDKQVVINMFVLIIFFIFASQNFFIIHKVSAAEYNLAFNSSNLVLTKKQKEINNKHNFVDNEANAKSTKDKWENYIKDKYKDNVISYIDRGIIHIKFNKIINSRPVKINVVEINKKINQNLEFIPVLASDNNLASKSHIKKIAEKNNSIIAINGSFFKPQNGIPLGSLMIDGKLLTGPMYDRVALGIFDNEFKMERVSLNAVVVNKNYKLIIDNINQPRMLSTYVIAYSQEWGEYAPESPKYGLQVAINDNKIIEYSYNRLKIPKNGYVIVGPEEKLKELITQKDINIEFNINESFKGVNHIISGGPYLIKNNNIYIDVDEQKLNSITGKNPRTAIGLTSHGSIILVTVDGREENSVGMTLNELALFMKSLDCVDAMNLDGGGSSVMFINGNVVNSPSIKGGIAISNALTISINDKKTSLANK